MINNKHDNAPLPQILENFINWDLARSILTESTPDAQFEKFLEEVIELYAAMHPEKSADGIKFSIVNLVHSLHKRGKIKAIPVNDDPVEHLTDALGDSLKCLTTLSEMHYVPLGSAAHHSYMIIKDRGGKMVNGIWEKDA